MKKRKSVLALLLTLGAVPALLNVPFRTGEVYEGEIVQKDPDNVVWVWLPDGKYGEFVVDDETYAGSLVGGHMVIEERANLIGWVLDYKAKPKRAQ